VQPLDFYFPRWLELYSMLWWRRYLLGGFYEYPLFH
jgi:hypothetical protein